jgi:hypothetical protein
VNNLGVLVKAHEARLADAEARISRATFVMPRRDP